MPSYLRTASGLVQVTPYLRTTSGLVALVPYLRTDSGLVIIGASGTLAVSVSPESLFRAASVNSTVTITTNSATATVSGGSGTYTYVWSGTPGWIIGTPSAISTTFSMDVAPGTTETGSFTCTVNGTATSNVVSVVATNYGTA